MIKKLLHDFTASLCFAVLILSLAVNSFISSLTENFRSDVLRLHIIASSENDCDIALKNTVRDGLLPEIRSIYGKCKSFDEAVCLSRENQELLKNKAVEILRQNGCDDDVEIIIGNKNYDERVYGGITYPAGEYCSLRIVIGEGKGSNWWCVLFSPLTDIGIERQGNGREKKLTFKFLQWFS